MGSVKAFRSLFTQRVPQPFPADIAQRQTSSKRFDNSRGRLLRMLKPDSKTGAIRAHSCICSGGLEEVGYAEECLPHVPQKAHTGIKTYIYHNNGVNANALEILLESGRGRGLQPIAECKAESD